MCKIMLGTGMIVAYAYSIEFFTAWYSGSPIERFTFLNRAFGPYAWAFWCMFTCNVFAPQFLWFKRCRNNLLVVFIVAMFINCGMWFERFVIIVTSLTRDFLPTSWWHFVPTPIDAIMLLGSFGLFFTLFLLFIRFLPVVAMAEVKTVMPQAQAHGEHGELTADSRKTDYWPDEHHGRAP